MITLGGPGAATPAVGTTPGTVAAGDDTRITGAAQKSANLSDLTSGSTARTNLGLATVATSGSYTDLSSKPTIPAAYTDEQARDAIGAALVAGSNVTVTVNDAADTITIAASGGGTVSDATASAKGIVQLAGDLGGTAAAPTVPTKTALSVNGSFVSTYNLDTTAVTPADIGAQPVDSDLTAIAGLDATTSGAIASDGAGWIKKTYAQLKTALGLVKGDVGLGSVDNTADTAKPVSTAQQTALDAKAAKASNLSDLASASTARTNLGLGTLATTSPTGTASSTTFLRGDNTWAAPSGGGSAVAEAVSNGFKAWAYDPVVCINNLAVTAGGIVMARCVVQVAGTLTKLYTTVDVAGVGPTTGGVLGCIYDSSLNLIGQTGDVGSSMTSTGNKTLTLSAGVTVTAGQVVLVGLLWQGTTPPKLVRTSSPSNTYPYQGNGGDLSSPQSRFMSVWGQTSLPSTIPTDHIDPTYSYWFAVA